MAKESYLDKTGKFDTHKWVRKNTTPINEGMKSNIKQRWKTVKDIENDLVQFMTDANDAGGPDLLKDIMKAISKARDVGLDLSMHRER